MGLPVDAGLVQGISYGRKSSYKAVQMLLSLSEPSTALFVSSSVLGEIALSAIRERGLHIPGDISFIMFDDAPRAMQTTPSISVVNQPTHDLGYKSLRLLDQRMAQAAVKIVMEPQLILRDSSLPLSVAHQPPTSEEAVDVSMDK
jgi:LacI family transcriptional regulator